MQLKRLIIHNIRSYASADISFPDGIVMLSGDIGAGKSSILLAIEFALFGLLRGELSGTALLRHGAQQGSVELAFTVGKDEYHIKRALKRSKKSVEQDAGYLLINGVKQAGTATELKSTILSILGYPAELLSKGKNFVYRYTVYTPQEDMKRILFEDREQRVAILRKVFDIDKYERITANATSYTKALRERKRAIDAVLVDLTQKQQQTEQTKKDLAAAEHSAKEFLPKLETTRGKLEEAKKKLAAHEQQREHAYKLQQDMQLTYTQLVSKQQQHKQVTQDLTDARSRLAQMNLEQQPIDVTTIAKQKQEKHQKLLENDTRLRERTIKITECHTLKKQAEEAQQNIAKLSVCPTCKQDVDSGHKHSIISEEQRKLSELGAFVFEHQQTIKQLEEEKKTLQTQIDELQKQEKDAAVINMQISHAQELSKRTTLLEQQHTQLAGDIKTLEAKHAELKTQAEPLQNIAEAFVQTKKEVDELFQQERQLSITHSNLEQKKQHLVNTLTILEKDVGQKLQAKARLEQTQHIHHWLSDYFIPLMQTIEKHVMAKIHHEFDALFQQWFSILVEDAMSARLDETFTPIVTQNGFDTEIEHLSGGEKTACALAYRLALNKTINSLISGIKTKNLLILDEPTDGFSAEQLDKMRDVLDQLSLQQVIIVSHEQKIESFADHIVRVAKRNHHSEIA